MSDAPHAITSLSLENFRNYSALSLEIGPRPVVLRGHNGAGKTNILEAISLLSPGRGFRQARLREMDRRLPVNQSATLDDSRLPRSAPATAWVVAANVSTHGESHHIGTGRDPESSMEKRLVKIDGVRPRSAAQLTDYTCIQWLTPSMDQIFVEGGTARRNFLDRIVYGFVPDHASRVAAYTLAMRERNRLLADRQTADPYWLSVLEQQMAEHAVVITLARQDVVTRLASALAEPLSHFSRALIGLEGTLETWLNQGNSALDVESKFAERLVTMRIPDAARGRAAEGPQRSNLSVIHREKNMFAEDCSTGEQKALLLSILIASAQARAAWCGLPPILLLDEVIAHLDVDKRGALFDLIRATAIQAWMTGTDAADFSGLQGDATHLEIAGGTVEIC